MDPVRVTGSRSAHPMWNPFGVPGFGEEAVLANPTIPSPSGIGSSVKSFCSKAGTGITPLNSMPLIVAVSSPDPVSGSDWIQLKLTIVFGTGMSSGSRGSDLPTTSSLSV